MEGLKIISKHGDLVKVFLRKNMKVISDNVNETIIRVDNNKYKFILRKNIYDVYHSKLKNENINDVYPSKHIGYAEKEDVIKFVNPDKWGNRPGELAYRYYYISDDYIRDEAQNYAYELYYNDMVDIMYESAELEEF